MFLPLLVVVDAAPAHNESRVRRCKHMLAIVLHCCREIRKTVQIVQGSQALGRLRSQAVAQPVEEALQVLEGCHGSASPGELELALLNSQFQILIIEFILNFELGLTLLHGYVAILRFEPKLTYKCTHLNVHVLTNT